MSFIVVWYIIGLLCASFLTIDDFYFRKSRGGLEYTLGSLIQDLLLSLLGPILLIWVIDSDLMKDAFKKIMEAADKIVLYTTRVDKEDK